MEMAIWFVSPEQASVAQSLPRPANELFCTCNTDMEFADVQSWIEKGADANTIFKTPPAKTSS